LDRFAEDSKETHSETFFSFWKDADPRIPEVEDAWERLAGLQKVP
jgi:hypothetical protein